MDHRRPHCVAHDDSSDMTRPNVQLTINLIQYQDPVFEEVASSLCRKVTLDAKLMCPPKSEVGLLF